MTIKLYLKKAMKRFEVSPFANRSGLQTMHLELTATKTKMTSALLYAYVKAFAVFLILTICVLRSFAQDCISVLPTVIRYNVCDLPTSGDTLYYYSEFDVVNDGT